jgi:hypothetical protein
VVVVNLLKREATLTEQLVGLATLGSSRLFVDGDFVTHNNLIFDLWSLPLDLGTCYCSTVGTKPKIKGLRSKL